MIILLFILFVWCVLSINDIQDDIEDKSLKVDLTYSEVKLLNTKIVGLETKVKKLKYKNQGMRKQMSKLRYRIMKLEEKK